MMNFHSDEAIRVLKALDTEYETVEERLPAGPDWSLLPFLLSEGTVSQVWLVPPCKEPAYPNGLKAYIITSLGKEILYAADQKAKKEAKKNAKEKWRFFWSETKFWIGLVLGWLLGSFAPEEVYQWIAEFFQ